MPAPRSSRRSAALLKSKEGKTADRDSPPPPQRRGEAAGCTHAQESEGESAGAASKGATGGGSGSSSGSSSRGVISDAQLELMILQVCTCVARGGFGCVGRMHALTLPRSHLTY